MCFFDRQRGVDKEDLPDEMGQVITKCVWPPALPKQVSRNKKRDRQGQALKGEQEKNSDE